VTTGGGLLTAGIVAVTVGVVAVTDGVVAVTVGVLTPPPTGGCGRGLVGTVTVTEGNVMVKVGLVTVTDGVVSTTPPPAAVVVTGAVAVGSAETAPATVVVTAFTAPAPKADPAHPPSTRSEISPTGARTPRTSILAFCHGVPAERGPVVLAKGRLLHVAARGPRPPRASWRPRTRA
jgi:hypothetical protein